MKNGVPFDVAFSLDEVTAAGWCIAFSEMEGHQFDWSAMKFKES
ncbi:hypothetical protein [Aquabacterium olei]|nr:hypothetical protein [Aquabacterium olei]